jgi:4-amino-4-deoxy-L-arabinose transferase-like glycosyltransferase
MTSEAQRSRRAMAGKVAILVLVLAGATFLRFWRLGWALTDGTWFPDEVLWANSANLFWPLTWHSFVADFHLTRPYPAGYAIVTGVPLALLRGLGVVLFPDGKADAILVARTVSATAGIASVVLVGLYARRVGGAVAGIAAAALMAVVPLHAMQNHYASTDVLHTMCVALVMLAGHALVTRGTRTSAALLGAAAGLAFGTKYTGLAMLATGGVLVLDIAIRRRALALAVDLAIWVVAGFLLAFALACPPCALDPLRVVRMMQWQASYPVTEFVNNRLVPSLGWYGRPYVYQLVATFPYLLGWPVYVLVLLGFFAAVRRRDAGDRVVLATVVPFFLAIAASPVTFPRYLLPTVPGLVVLAARSGVLVPRAQRLWTTSVALACAYAFVLSASQIARYGLTPQLELARWIAASQPAGTTARIATPDTLTLYTLLKHPLAEAGLSSTAVPAGHWFDDAPDVFVLPDLHEIAARRDDPGGAAAADLARLESGALPYRAVRRWSERDYLQQDFYTWLDPGFGYSEGAMGFTVFVREPARVARSADGR